MMYAMMAANGVQLRVVIVRKGGENEDSAETFML